MAQWLSSFTMSYISSCRLHRAFSWNQRVSVWNVGRCQQCLVIWVITDDWWTGLRCWVLTYTRSVVFRIQCVSLETMANASARRRYATVITRQRATQRITWVTTLIKYVIIIFKFHSSSSYLRASAARYCIIIYELINLWQLFSSWISSKCKVLRY